MKGFLLGSLIFSSFLSHAAADKLVMDRVMYVNSMYAQVHKNPSKYSSYLTTTECGHPVKVYKKVSTKGGGTRVVFNRNWKLVKVGSYQGYMSLTQLSKRKPSCFQDQYPKFFDSISIEINEMFYWGKLKEQYVTGKSKAN